MSKATRVVALVVGAALLSTVVLMDPGSSPSVPGTSRGPAVASAPSGRDASPAPPPAVSPHVIEGWPDSTIVARKETLSEGGTTLERVTVVKSAFKYPYVRIVEKVDRDLAQGAERVVHRTEMVADHVVVRLNPGASTADLEAVVQAHGGRVLRKLRAAGIYLVGLPEHDPEAVPRALSSLARQSAVIARVEPDGIVRAAQSVPSDPRFGELWALHNSGQTGGTADADIDAPEAWMIATGSRDVRVAVLDTGVDYAHEDLAANMWVHPGELPGNGVDDDGNGFTDDLRGWDFYNDDIDPFDDHRHGTHVAGTIGAVGNNGRGVAGVCWRVTLMPLKVLGPDGAGVISDAVEAIHYASRMGAQVAVGAWGGTVFSAALRQAIADADAHGILFVAPSPNGGGDLDLAPFYPAAFDNPNIISVRSSDHRDLETGGHGLLSVDLSAPGVAILSCLPGNAYGLLSGTSSGVAHVAGACALLKSAVPDLGHLEIKAQILDTVDPTPIVQGRTVSGGRLNVFRALASSLQPFVTLKRSQVNDEPQTPQVGNGDGVANPGETIGFGTTLRNVSLFPAVGVTATLSLTAPDPNVSILGGTVLYGDIAARSEAEGSGQFLVAIAPSTPTPRNVGLTLTIQDAEGRSWTSRLTLSILTTFPVSGVVTRDGCPVSGATITFTGPLNGTRITRADGGYVFGATSGTYLVKADHPGFATSGSLFAVVPPPRTGLNFAFTTVTVSGVILDREAGEPLEGAVVRFSGPATGTATTGADGTYTFTTAVAPGATLTLDAFRPGSHQPSFSRTVFLPPSRVDINFDLRRFRYRMIDLAGPVAASPSVSDINNFGQIAGFSPALTTPHAILWQGGVAADLGTLGGISSFAHSINDRGVVVGGSSLVQDSLFHAFLHDGIGMVDLGTLDGSPFSRAFGVNNLRQVVGISPLMGTTTRAFLWRNGGMTDLGTLGGPTSFAFAINNLGQIVGTAETATPGASPAFLWRRGVMTSLGTLPGGEIATAQDINDLGQVVGISDDFPGPQSSEKAFLWQNGEMIALGTLGGGLSRARGINNLGQIVGESFVAAPDLPIGSTLQACLWEDGVAHNLNYLVDDRRGWALMDARAINDEGLIVCNAVIGPGSPNERRRAFLLEPIDRPPANEPPIAAELELQTAENTPISFRLPARDPEGDPLRYLIVQRPANGTLSGRLPNLTYTPNPSYQGLELLTFAAYDGRTSSNVASVKIFVVGVNDPPVAQDQIVMMRRDTSRTITLTATDADHNPLTFAIIDAPQQGTITGGSGPARTYTPDPGFTGIDSFTFTANDGLSTSARATVTVRVITPFAVVDLGTLGGSESVATAINNNGQVVGSSLRAASPWWQGFIWQAGEKTELPNFGGSTAEAFPQDLNDAGQIVGWGTGTVGIRAALWEGDVLTNLGGLTTGGSRAFGINAGGRIVGHSHFDFPLTWRVVTWSEGMIENLGIRTGAFGDPPAFAINDLGNIAGQYEPQSFPQPFAILDGVFTRLDIFGGQLGYALDINNQDDVVGWATYPPFPPLPGATRAFFWNASVGARELGTLGGATSQAYAINDPGQIVGTSGGPGASGQRAFLWDGAMFDLNDLVAPGSGWVLTTARDINVAGEIVGTGRLGSSVSRAFLLRPGGPLFRVPSIPPPAIQPDRRPRSIFAQEANDAAGLQERLDRASPGETVVLEAGIYVVPAGLRVKGGVSLAGAGPHRTILDGRGAETVLRLTGSRSEGGSTIQNLTVTGGQTGVDTGAADALLRNLQVVGQVGNGVLAGQAGVLEAISLTLADNGGSGAFLAGEGARLRGIIAARNGRFGVEGLAEGSVTFSDFFGNALGPATQDLLGVGVLFDPVTFRDPASFDYREVPGSATVDAGDPSDAFEREPRPNGSRINQGAFANTPEATPSAEAEPPVSVEEASEVRSSPGCGALGFDAIILLGLFALVRRRR